MNHEEYPLNVATPRSFTYVTRDIPRVTAAQRERALKATHYNEFAFPAGMLTVDMLSDSGTTAMTDVQWSAMFLGDESYGRNKGYYVLLDALRESGFELVVHPCDTRSPGYIDGVRRFVQQQKLHGVMLVPRASEDQNLADMLAELECRYTRIVPVGFEDTDGRMIVTHDRDGAAEAADYLLTLGHRDIALVTGPLAYRSAIERTEGFIDTLARRGIEVPKSRIIEASYTFESGVAAAEKLLAGKQRPTAIFCGNDEMAAGVYKVAMRAGISIPRELSVVGYDDSTLATRLWPSLTSVRRQTRDTGRIAASMLIRPDAGPLPVASVRPHLIVRDSCQPPA